MGVKLGELAYKGTNSREGTELEPRAWEKGEKRTKRWWAEREKREGGTEGLHWRQGKVCKTMRAH